MKKKKIIIISAVVVLLAVISCLAYFFIFKEEEVTGLEVDLYETDKIPLGSGLVITDIGKYTGMYIEDGSDEPISDIMMIILNNISGKDLQYAEIYVEYPSYTAKFVVSNLPNNGSVVLLEKNKHKAIKGQPVTADFENLLFFGSSMDTKEEVFEISGNNGIMNIKNISEEDITSPIEIYYKNSSTSLLYGGITYKATVPGGIKAGEMTQLYSSHFDSSNCKIVDIIIKET